MQWLWLMATAIVLGQAAEIVKLEDKYKNSEKCRACHNHIVNQWEDSWHAKSHYENDEYLQKSIDYVARKTSRKSLNTIKIECAACHNPRISVTSTTAEYEALAAMRLDKDTAATKALESDTISEGINCVVCHNIDQIHDELPADKRGIHRVSWMKSGIMSGPYADAKSPYHKVEHREFMDNNPNQLCFVCHANDTSEEGLRFIDMQSEFKPGTKQCVDCHMGERKTGIATTMRDANGQKQTRQVRTHGFIGAHTQSMWQGALQVEAKKNLKELEVTLANPQPHALPSGFGSREIVIEAEFRKGKSIIKSESLSVTTHYETKRGKPTIPHLASKIVDKNTIPAHGSKVFALPLAAGADNVVVSVSYRLVNDEVRGLLDLKDAIWSKKMLIEKINLKL